MRMGKELEYFKAALDGYLKKKGKSQNWLALNSGITQQTINNLCKGSFGKEATRDQLFDFIGTDFLSFLQYGKEMYEKKEADSPPKPQKPIISLEDEHVNITKKFKKKDRAIRINKKLVYAEQLDEDSLDKIERQIDLELEDLEKRTGLKKRHAANGE